MGSYLVSLSLFFQQALASLLHVLTTPFGVDGYNLNEAFTTARTWLISTGISLGDIDEGLQASYTPMALGLEDMFQFAQDLLFNGIDLPFTDDTLNLYSVVETILNGFGIDAEVQSLLAMAFTSALILVIITALVSTILGVISVVQRIISLTKSS